MDVSGPSSHFYFSKRLRLHYADWGNRSAEPVILLHGGRDHCRAWDFVARPLQSDWHVIAPDLRGHGNSDHVSDGSYSLEAMVYDLAQLVRHTTSSKVSIVAHSLGGMISLAFAGLFPERVKNLVIIEGLSYPPVLEKRWASMTVDQRLREWCAETQELSARAPRRYSSLAEAAQRMLAQNSHLTQEMADHLTFHGSVQNEDGTFSWKFDDYLRALHPVNISRSDMRALWERITAPTLLIYGSDSWAVPASQDGELQYFQDAREIIVEGAGHWVHLDQRQMLLEHIQTFLGEPARA